MSLNAVFQGAPTNVPSPGAAAALGLDEVNGVLYYTSPQSNGWKAAKATSAAAGFSGTVPLAAITANTGTAGSLTIVNGIITAVVQPT